MKRRGTTLIEISVVLGLLSILLLIGVKGFGVYKRIIYDIQIKQSLYDIEDTLSYGKEYCYNNSKEGDYYLEKSEDSLNVIFKCGDNKIRETTLPSSIKLAEDEWMTGISSKVLSISNDGYIKPETINFKDEKGARYKITIRPGGNIITVKEEF